MSSTQLAEDWVIGLGDHSATELRQNFLHDPHVEKMCVVFERVVIRVVLVMERHEFLAYPAKDRSGTLRGLTAFARNILRNSSASSIASSFLKVCTYTVVIMHHDFRAA